MHNSIEPTRPNAPRGRPVTITRQRIAAAGIAIGLPDITFVGVAAALGVSHVALYRHVSSLDALKCLVAEEIFSRWSIPPVEGSGRDGLQAYLSGFSASVRDFVRAHPGLTPYVIRRSVATQPMREKIDAHHSEVARVYGIPKEHARWLLATVAFHCLAVADTVYSVAGREPLAEADRAGEQAEMQAELDQGMEALVVGALVLLERRLNAAAA